MLADLALSPVASRWPATVVARVTAGKAVRSGTIWGAVFGVYLATQALAYASTYKTAAARATLVKDFGSNTGVAAIAGPAREIGTVAGFTVWKCLAVLAVVGAVWGLLLGTRLLRGEEDAGRWELLLAGQTTRRRAAVQGLVGLGAGLVSLLAVTGALFVAVGQSSKVDFEPSSALFLAVASVAGAGMFLAVGALTSQLAPTRRQAAGYAAAVLGVSYALRMLADSGAGLAWLRWATPLGWVEELRPLTGTRLLALVPIVVLIAVAVALTVALAGRRDLGASTVPDRVSAEPRTRLLGGPAGLALRLARPTLLSWGLALGAMGLLLGFVSKSAGSALTSSPTIRAALSSLGVHGNGAAAYLGLAFLIVAVLVAFVAAGQVSAARAEEAEGRLEHLLVRPCSRASWFSDRLGLAGGAVLAGGLLAGVAAWIGATSQGAGVRFATLLTAGLNVVPPSLCLLGIGALAIGAWPRAAPAIVYGLLAWSFLVELVGGIVHLNHWVLDTSVFHQVASAPAVPVDWVSGGALVGVGVATALLGGVAFRRRDLAGE